MPGARDFAPGTPRHLRGRLVEVDRREWADPGSFSFGAITAFLEQAGVVGAQRAAAGAVGAAVLISGDVRPPACAALPAASPAPAVPAACVVVYRAGSPEAAPTGNAGARIGPWRQSWSAAQHAAAVTVIREAIAAGQVYQSTIVAHRQASFDGSSAAVAAALATLPETPYAGSMSGARWSVVSASPECLLEVRDGIATTRPIKGTAEAFADPEQDARARVSLLNSEKDRAEHIMIVDLARNDLGRVASSGGVSVPELFAVRRLAGVWHAESTVRAVLDPAADLTSLLQAVFPGGSVTGAPKLAALDAIAQIEPVGRGPAMGAMGWIGSDGDIRLGLTIRTVAVADGSLHLWTGGGITWGSDPVAEVAEAQVKAAPLLRILRTIPS